MKKAQTKPVAATFGISGDQNRNRPGWIAAVAALCLFVLVSAMTASAFSQARGPRSVADLAETLQGAVVNVSTTQTLKGGKGIPFPSVPKGSPFEEFFDDFFNRQQRPDRPRKVNSLGSGFVIDPSGLIVTTTM